MSEDTRTNKELMAAVVITIRSPVSAAKPALSALAELKRRADEGQAARQEIERLNDLTSRLKGEAETWAQEARTQRATVNEIMQAVSGATGEKGDWNGAQPVKDALEAKDAEIERYKVALGELIHGIRYWASQEDGIPDFVWTPYSNAMLLLGWSFVGEQPAEADRIRAEYQPEAIARFEEADRKLAEWIEEQENH